LLKTKHKQKKLVFGTEANYYRVCVICEISESN